MINQTCACTTLAAGAAPIDPGSHPHLFSNTLTYLSALDAHTMAMTIAAIERVAALPAYQHAALQAAPDIASHAFGPRGVFMGYDFHLSPKGPRLIEINTNAGGALLNTAVLRAHRACCDAMAPLSALNAMAEPLEAGFVQMFQAEWALQRTERPLQRIAIVDDNPAHQYLAPEFTLFQQLFQAHGLQAVVADPQDLVWRDGGLWHAAWPDHPVDLVYNRLTDFDLSEPRHDALRRAYLHQAVVLTPHPRVHATHADKRRLIALSDADQLAAWGVAEADRQLLSTVVPRTRAVTKELADELWAQRRELFFKPVTGYGSKGTYRGDKLTRRVWEEILHHAYIAQDLVAPSLRRVRLNDGTVLLKQDIRAYSYAGEIQLLAARSYAGQTTNFRTEGGGFSPVMLVPERLPANLGRH